MTESNDRDFTDTPQEEKEGSGKKKKKPTPAQRIKELETEKERLEKQNSDLYEVSLQNLDLSGALGWVLPGENRRLHIKLWAIQFRNDVKTVSGWITSKSIPYYGPSASNCYVYIDDMMAGLRGVHTFKRESSNEKTS